MGKTRMENLLKVVGAALASYVQCCMRGLDLWMLPFAELKGSLIGASQLLR